MSDLDLPGSCEDVEMVLQLIQGSDTCSCDVRQIIDDERVFVLLGGLDQEVDQVGYGLLRDHLVDVAVVGEQSDDLFFISIVEFEQELSESRLDRFKVIEPEAFIVFEFLEQMRFSNALFAQDYGVHPFETQIGDLLDLLFTPNVCTCERSIIGQLEYMLLRK